MRSTIAILLIISVVCIYSVESASLFRKKSSKDKSTKDIPSADHKNKAKAPASGQTSGQTSARASAQTSARAPAQTSAQAKDSKYVIPDPPDEPVDLSHCAEGLTIPDGTEIIFDGLLLSKALGKTVNPYLTDKKYLTIFYQIEDKKFPNGVKWMPQIVQPAEWEQLMLSYIGRRRLAWLGLSVMEVAQKYVKIYEEIENQKQHNNEQKASPPKEHVEEYFEDKQRMQFPHFQDQHHENQGLGYYSDHGHHVSNVDSFPHSSYHTDPISEVEPWKHDFEHDKIHKWHPDDPSFVLESYRYNSDDDKIHQRPPADPIPEEEPWKFHSEKDKSHPWPPAPFPHTAYSEWDQKPIIDHSYDPPVEHPYFPQHPQVANSHNPPALVPHNPQALFPHNPEALIPHITHSAVPRGTYGADPHVIYGAAPHIPPGAVPHSGYEPVPLITQGAFPHSTYGAPPHSPPGAVPHSSYEAVPLITQDAVTHGNYGAAPHISPRAVPHSSYGADPHSTYGAIPPGAVPHSSYEAVPLISQEAVPHGAYGAVPQGAHGAFPHGTYGAVPHSSHGAIPHGAYGAVPQSPHRAFPHGTYGAVPQSPHRAFSHGTYGTVPQNAFGAFQANPQFPGQAFVPPGVGPQMFQQGFGNGYQYGSASNTHTQDDMLNVQNNFGKLQVSTNEADPDRAALRRRAKGIGHIGTPKYSVVKKKRDKYRKGGTQDDSSP